MCKHYWRVDSYNKGVCKLCGKVKDFQLGIDKLEGNSTKYPVRGNTLCHDLCMTGGFYLQGGFHREYGFKTFDDMD